MKNILVVLLITLLAACERDIIIDVPSQTPKLVVNGIIRTNTPISISIGKTIGVLDVTTSTNKVNNAFAELFENSVLKDTLIYKTYLSSLKFIGKSSH